MEEVKNITDYNYSLKFILKIMAVKIAGKLRFEIILSHAYVHWKPILLLKIFFTKSHKEYWCTVDKF